MRKPQIRRCRKMLVSHIYTMIGDHRSHLDHESIYLGDVNIELNTAYGPMTLSMHKLYTTDCVLRVYCRFADKESSKRFTQNKTGLRCIAIGRQQTGQEAFRQVIAELRSLNIRRPDVVLR